MRILPVLAALLSATAILAGCTSSSSSTDALDAFDEAEARIGEPLDTDGLLVAGAAPAVNLELLAALGGAPGRTPGIGEVFVESAVKGGYAYICRMGTDQALVVFDVRDIENPVYVGELALHAGFEPDVEVSDDGRWAFWETQRAHLAAPPVPPATDPAANLPNGIHVIDLEDKADPRWVSFTPVLPDGPHAITYASLGGRHYVFASVYAYAYNHDPYVAAPGLQRLAIYVLNEAAAVPTLELVSEFVDPAAAAEDPYPAGGEMFPHDVTVQRHPVTGQDLAYIAYWDLGVVIVDVSDPANPVKVGQADDFGPTPYANIHMARSFPHLIDGRHVTVTEPEIAGQEDSGYLTFFDTTDPTAPTYISRWKIPGNASNAGTGGPHYFDTGHGRVALGHYNAGFWVIDVHDAANLANPRTTAYAMPQPVQPGALPALPGLAPGWGFDAWWADATHIVASDSGAGLMVFRYDGPSPEPVEA